MAYSGDFIAEIRVLTPLDRRDRDRLENGDQTEQLLSDCWPDSCREDDVRIKVGKRIAENTLSAVLLETGLILAVILGFALARVAFLGNAG